MARGSGRWQQPLTAGPSILRSGGSAPPKGHAPCLPSISWTFLLRMLASFFPSLFLPTNNYFRFLFSLFLLRGSRAAPLSALSPFPTHSLQDLMHCCLPSTLLISTTFCFLFFPSAGEISEPKPGSHLCCLFPPCCATLEDGIFRITLQEWKQRGPQGNRSPTKCSAGH